MTDAIRGARTIPTGSGRHRTDLRWALVFVAPAAIGFLTFYLWPLVRGVYVSFTTYNIFLPPVFTGLANYQHLTQDPLFWNSLLVTAEYVVINISTEMVLALGIAVLMDRLTRSVVIRVAIIFPWLVPNVAVGIVSLFMLDKTVGVINMMLEDLGLQSQYFYQDPNQAIATIALVNTWRNMGYTALLLFAGMQAIPRNLYEAAEVDGASPWMQFRRITLPLLRPVLALVLVASVTGSFQIFDTVSVVYQHPIPEANVLYYYIYNAAFAQGRMGYASAMAVVLILITGVLAAIQLRLLRASQSDLA